MRAISRHPDRPTETNGRAFCLVSGRPEASRSLTAAAETRRSNVADTATPNTAGETEGA
jgi:hypothetical protein